MLGSLATSANAVPVVRANQSSLPSSWTTSITHAEILLPAEVQIVAIGTETAEIQPKKA